MNRKRVLRWLVVLAAVAMITVNALANSLPINGLDTGEISDRFDIYFVPAGYVFSIWGLIYLGIAAFVIYQVLPATKDNPRLNRISILFIISSAANISWIFLWHYLQFNWTLLAMLTLLVSLILIYQQLETGKTEVGAAEFWLVRVVFSVYLGWISVATIANTTQFLYVNEWSGWGISDAAWAAIMLGVATVLGWIIALTRKDIPYLLVFVWAFIGIAVEHQSSQLVSVSAWVAAGLCALAVLVTAYRRLSKAG